MIPQAANAYLDVKDTSISRILSSFDPTSSKIRSHSVKLIIEAMGNEERKEVSAIDDLICLPLSLWLLRYVNEHVLTSRVINHARDIVEDFLSASSLAPEFVPDYARRYGVPIQYSDEDEVFTMSVGTFVSFTSRVSGFKYRLVYQNVRKGIVYTDREIAAKVIREAFVRNVLAAYETIEPGKTVTILQPMKSSIDEIIERLQKSGITKNFDLGEVDFNLFPPCIKEYITEMQDGVNLPHLARFTLVSFLHKIGMDNQGIIALFKTAPDFRETLTTYQVNHVTGEISSTEYSPPKCTVLQSNHLCYMGDDPICHKEWLKHPLQYYTLKKKPRKEPPKTRRKAEESESY
ncbi:MAG: DNA primase large subunit PriL [Candidatus Thermoplasmatota archaeon]|jgi:DNA primase large subunit|nr:DNA primase large subunit PriL [Candidatus Thermoplasmatota archaeon]MCL5955132.1 DNA primase large subunit PriL [Candidatus Thermoplasmatota archaeon]